jgi:hypothetical protein
MKMIISIDAVPNIVDSEYQWAEIFVMWPVVNDAFGVTGAIYTEFSSHT